MGEGEEIKQVIVVRSDLKMGKGKICVEVAHASLEAYKRALKKWPKVVRAWEETGSKKIVVKADLEKLLELKEWADSEELPNALIKDAGLTQIPPGSITALAIGPAPAEMLKKTRDLKLL